jgi:hypothetical protein
MNSVRLVVIFVAASTVLANAQEANIKKDTYPVWTISKGVQRLQFKDMSFVPAKIALGDVAFVASKDVHKKSIEKRSGFVATNGYPTWAISKGVARQQAERNTKRQ